MVSAFSGITYPQPIIGKELSDGTKNISVYDHNAGCMKSFNVKSQDVDEFISSRQNAIKTQNQKQAKAFILPTAIGTVLGTAISLLNKNIDKKASKWLGNVSIWMLGVVLGAVSGIIAAYSIKQPNQIDAEFSQDFINKYSNK